jgi:glyoxylase-like metal-dependent hydrolase (beta-lactamase superfamily II)
MPLIHRIDHPHVDGVRVGALDRKGNWRLTGTCIVYRIGDACIDTGPSNEWRLVEAFLNERKVKQALITHYHEDHSGNGGHIHDTFNANVLCHENSHSRLKNGFAIEMVRKLTFGQVSLVSTEHFPDRIAVGDGIELQPLHFPGHSDDMTCFYEPKRGWLFSGDLYIASQIKYMTREENVSQMINSLRAAMQLDFRELFCAHRGIVSDGPAALAKKLDFIVSLREEVHYWRDKGLPVRAITRQLIGKEDITALVSGFNMSKRNVITACLRSLEEEEEA